MRFLIQQKFFTLKDRFFIKDERGYDCYEIADKLVTVGNKFWVNTVDGNNLYFMRQKLFHLMPHYEIYQGEEVVANVRARFRFFRAKVEVQSDRFGDILITGNVMNWDFEIKRGDEMLAVINKHIFKVRDTYTLEIMARIDPVHTPSKFGPQPPLLFSLRPQCWSPHCNRPQNKTSHTKKRPEIPVAFVLEDSDYSADFGCFLRTGKTISASASGLLTAKYSRSFGSHSPKKAFALIPLRKTMRKPCKSRLTLRKTFRS